MSSYQVPVGQALFSLLKTRTKLVAEASVDISTETSHFNLSDLSLSTWYDLDLWIRAKPCFTFSYVFTFDDDTSLPALTPKAFRTRLGKALSEAELWSQLHLKAAIDASYDNPRTNGQTSVTLRLQIRKQDAANHDHPDHASRLSDSAYDTGNMKPPCRVPTIVLCAVNLSFTFSYLGSTVILPQKRPRSESEGFLDLFDDPGLTQGSALSSIGCVQKRTQDEENLWVLSQHSKRKTSNLILNDINTRMASAFNHYSSDGTFADLLIDAVEDDGDGTGSHGFSSQGSTIFQSQRSPPKKTPTSNSSFDIPSVLTLTDAAFRSLICQRPIRTAPGIRNSLPAFGTTLTDIVPSTFCPRYAEAVAARASLIPTVARFLISFIQKSKSQAVRTKKGVLLRHSSSSQSASEFEGAQQGGNEEAKLKEIVKSHLWMTMANGLRNPEPARRLKPLQPFAKANYYANGMLDIEDIEPEHDEFHDILDQSVLSQYHDAWAGPTCAEAGDDDGMLDFLEDEADEYDEDLIEMYEERLRNGFDHNNASTLDLGDHEEFNFLEGLSTPHDPADSLFSSPMLEMQNSLPQPRSAAEEVRTSIEQAPDLPRPVTSGTAHTSDNVGDHDSWISLLEDESHPDFRVVDGQQTRSNSMISPADDDWEPDFEQWEFDVEQGSDEMLF